MFAVYLFTFRFSGYLFPFYQEVYEKHYHSFGRSSSGGVIEVGVEGNQFEAWKVLYILDKKDPADRFK
jgi:hypothetical protein